MATLADCATADFRERMLRYEKLGTPLPWEDTTGGTPSSWPFTQYVGVLHKTGDPGEGATLATNKADYVGYADILYPRGATHWSIVNGGTATPYATPKEPFTWPANTGVDQDIYAVSIGLRHSATDYAIARHVLAAPLTIPNTGLARPNIGGFNSRIGLDHLVASGTNNAAYSSWEEAEAKYIAYGGEVGYTGGFPGMTTNGNAQPSAVCLLKSDPRTALLYPNVFRTVGAKNATYEPTSVEYEGYLPVAVPRVSTDPDSWEAVDTGGGTWVFRNKTLLQFPASTGGSTGCTLTHALVCFFGSPNLFLSANYYSVRVAELDTPIVIPAGGGAGPQIPAQGLVFEIR